METNLSETLFQVAEKTLESLAFMFCFPGEPEEMPAESLTTVDADFSGPFDGVLRMTVTEEVLPELAVNMLGMEESDAISLDEQQDALGEALNVICGNLLPAIAGKKAIFEIARPRVVPSDDCDARVKGKIRQADTCLELEEGACELQLFTDEPLTVEGDAAAN